MRAYFHHVARQLIVVGGAIVCVNFMAYQIVIAVEKSCSNKNCVMFAQWSVNANGGQECREALGDELWSHLNACCNPDVDQAWCTNLTSVLNLGLSTRRKLEYGSATCTEASCARERPQVALPNMFIADVNATRYECYDVNEE